MIFSIQFPLDKSTLKPCESRDGATETTTLLQIMAARMKDVIQREGSKITQRAKALRDA